MIRVGSRIDFLLHFQRRLNFLSFRTITDKSEIEPDTREVSWRKRAWDYWEKRMAIAIDEDNNFRRAFRYNEIIFNFNMACWFQRIDRFKEHILNFIIWSLLILLRLKDYQIFYNTNLLHFSYN